MTFRFSTLALVVPLFSAAAHAATTSSPDAHEIVSESMAAMGWKHDLHKLQSSRAQAEIVTFDVVENDHAGTPYYLRGTARATIIDDLRNDRRSSVTTPPRSRFAQSAPSTRSILTHAANVVTTGSGEKARTQALGAPPSWETHNPIRALLLAERAPDLVRDPDTVLHHAPQHVVAFHHGRYRVRILVDAETQLPSATEAAIALHRADSADIAWNAWGDVAERTEYLNWRLVQGLRYPLQWDVYRNDALMRIVSMSHVEFDVPLHAAQFALPKKAREAANQPSLYADDLKLGQPVPRAPNPGRPIEEIAPGIVQIPNSWYVTLVRQDDGIVVIDAPISAGYSKQVLAEAARRFPDLPVKAVITSTAFYWHIAGVREYAAKGIPIYVRSRNLPIMRDLLAASHTLVPDDLARHPGKPIIRSVSGRTVIGHGKNAIVLWPIRFATQPMLMTYIPDAHLLHTAEMVQPLGPNGSILFPESLIELDHSVHYAHIPTDHLTLIGMHMSPTPWSAIGQTLRAATADNQTASATP